jgi:DNA-binding transcriptional LysR family regulator
MKKQDAIEKAGGLSNLAEILHITPSAISQWVEEVPEARLWQLKVLRPEWFTKKPSNVNLASL